MAGIDRSGDRPDARIREVRIPLDTILAWVDAGEGRNLVFPVKVGWPELQLTGEQILSNSFALDDGEPPPYPDRSIFQIVVE